MGVDEDLAHTSIRFGIGFFNCFIYPLISFAGRFTTEKEIDYAIDLLTSNVERLRQMSPLYEMVQEGVDIKSIQWTQDK